MVDGGDILIFWGLDFFDISMKMENVDSHETKTAFLQVTSNRYLLNRNSHTFQLLRKPHQ